MHHQIPQSADPRRTAMAAAVSSCVHCGFCLPACPTYKVLGEEMDSPRGRIVLMKDVLEGTLPLAEAAPHLDRCLGCLACETACPSGVRYRDLIEPMRDELVAARPPVQRFLLGGLLRIMASPSLFRAAAALGAGAKAMAPVVPRALRPLLDLVPTTIPAPMRPPVLTPAIGPRRGRVALMTGCVQQVLAPGITDAALRVLAANGVEVVVPGGQGCCGALALHAGEHAAGRAHAVAHEATFPADVDAILATAAGCGSSMKATHTHGAPVLDVTEYLDRLGLVTPLALDAPVRVVYQDACHLAHAQQIPAPPRRLLGTIGGVTLAPLSESSMCCGSAGLYNIEQPDIAAALGARKAAAIAASGATLVASGNIGCLTQLQTSLKAAALAVDAVHTVELIAMALPRQRGSQ